VSKIIAVIVAVRDIIYAVMAFVTRVKKEKKKSEIKEAKDDALEEQDQRKLEEALGGGGKPTKHKYSGMFTRKRKDRS